MAELQRLGARSLPVVSRGDDFVFAQVIKDAIAFASESPDPDVNEATRDVYTQEAAA